MLIIHIGLGYIYTCQWDPQYNKERKGKGKVNNLNNYTLSNNTLKKNADTKNFIGNKQSN